MTHRILTITLLLLTFAFPATAQEQTDKNQGYTLIETMPNVGEAGEKVTFTKYLTGVYTFAIAFVVIAALLMITIGGFYYITSAGNQAQAGTAKKIITDALIGLVVVFVTWLVLFTINPDLLNTTPDLGSVQVSGGGGGSEGLPWQQIVNNAPIKPKPITSVIDPATGKEYDTNGECLDANGQQNLCVSKQEYLKDDKMYQITEDENGNKTYTEVVPDRCVRENITCEKGSTIKLGEMYDRKSVLDAQKQLESVGIVPADEDRRVALDNYAGATIDAATDFGKAACGEKGCKGMQVLSTHDGHEGTAPEITLAHEDSKKNKTVFNKLTNDAALVDRESTRAGAQQREYTETDTYVYPQDHPAAGTVVKAVKTMRFDPEEGGMVQDVQFVVFGNKANNVPKTKSSKPPLRPTTPADD